MEPIQCQSVIIFIIVVAEKVGFEPTRTKMSGSLANFCLNLIQPFFQGTSFASSRKGLSQFVWGPLSTE